MECKRLDFWVVDTSRWRAHKQGRRGRESIGLLCKKFIIICELVTVAMWTSCQGVRYVSLINISVPLGNF